MQISNNKQGTEKWLEDRVGKLTGTRIKSILTPVKLTLAKGYYRTIFAMIDENITGISNESTFKNDDMQRGNDIESAARKRYIKLTGNDIIECGLCFSETQPLHALSPDGFTPDFVGAVEIKCPNGATHAGYVYDEIDLSIYKEFKFPNGANHLGYVCDEIDSSIYKDYKLQCINYFIVNPKLQWLDTVSFRPEFYPCPIHIKRITRQEIAEDIAKVSAAIDTFFERYNKLFLQLTF